MYDRVFGKVEYDYGWCVPTELTLFDIQYKVTCVASAYKNETINKLQRSQYARYKENEKEILKNIEQIIKEYVDKNHSDYSLKLRECLTPKEMIFHQNGDTGIFFECEWDVETGVVVGIFPRIGIINPDIFL